MPTPTISGYQVQCLIIETIQDIPFIIYLEKNIYFFRFRFVLSSRTVGDILISLFFKLALQVIKMSDVIFL